MNSKKNGNRLNQSNKPTRCAYNHEGTKTRRQKSSQDHSFDTFLQNWDVEIDQKADTET
jgi:hypothetical protein